MRMLTAFYAELSSVARLGAGHSGVVEQRDMHTDGDPRDARDSCIFARAASAAWVCARHKLAARSESCCGNHSDGSECAHEMVTQSASASVVTRAEWVGFVLLEEERLELEGEGSRNRRTGTRASSRTRVALEARPRRA
jgi:hypothetical protein